MQRSRVRVLIAGGGVAGLETLLALHGLADDRVALSLIAPEDEFIYRPVTSEKPVSVGAARSIGLRKAAQDVGGTFVAGTLNEVELDAGTVGLSTGERMTYDALVLAVGAEATAVVDHAMTWDDRSGAETIGGLLEDFEQGYSERLAVVIPPGPGWPLRGYELALMITLEAYDMSADIQTTLVTPELPPLALLGDHAVKVIARELERAGIAVASADHVRVERGRHATVVLEPSGQRLEVNRVLAMPILRGRRIDGIPVDGQGLIDIDEHCRVRDVERVWAAGDCTAFPLKSGSVSAAQADAAAEDIAAMAGAPVQVRPFRPEIGEELAGLPAGRFLEERVGAEEPGLSMHLPTADVPVLTYLREDLLAGVPGPH